MWRRVLVATASSAWRTAAQTQAPRVAVMKRGPRVATNTLRQAVRPFSSDYSAHMRAVVANVLKTLPKPGLPMTITYPSGATVGFGNTLTPTEVTEVPTVSWEADPQAFYTVILTDPDAPSRDLPAFREFIHWVVVNIPGNNLAKGDTVAKYVGAGPPHKSGLHGYIFLLYKQPAPLPPAEVEAAKTFFEPRGGLKAAAWARERGLGEPISIRAYEAEWDESVDALHETLGFMPPEEYRSPKQAAKMKEGQ